MSNIKELIRREIERLEEIDYPVDTYEQSVGFYDALDRIKSFLDTLPDEPVEKNTSYDTQKYTPSSSVSIEDVARVQFASHAKVFDKKRKAVFDWEQFKEVASIFYGFGKRGREPVSDCHDLEEDGWYLMPEAKERLNAMELGISFWGSLFTYLRKRGKLDGLCKLGRRGAQRVWLYDVMGIAEKVKKGELKYKQR